MSLGDLFRFILTLCESSWIKVDLEKLGFKNRSSAEMILVDKPFASSLYIVSGVLLFHNWLSISFWNCNRITDWIPTLRWKTDFIFTTLMKLWKYFETIKKYVPKVKFISFTFMRSPSIISNCVHNSFSDNLLLIAQRHN